jgi:hypothetical protein
MLLKSASDVKTPTAKFVLMTKHVTHVNYLSITMSMFVRLAPQNANNVLMNSRVPTVRLDTFLRMICALRVTRVVMNVW